MPATSVRAPEPVERDARQQHRGFGRQHRGLDLAGSDGVDADAEPAKSAAISRVNADNAAFEVE